MVVRYDDLIAVCETIYPRWRDEAEANRESSVPSESMAIGILRGHDGRMIKGSNEDRMGGKSGRGRASLAKPRNNRARKSWRRAYIKFSAVLRRLVEESNTRHVAPRRVRLFLARISVAQLLFWLEEQKAGGCR